MALTEIEYGALASSAVLNSNFTFLLDKITELSATITSETSSYSSTVATLNNSINSLLAYRESFIPTGTIIASQSSEIPAGFLLCDGSEIRISEYQDLYDVIGATYGQSDSTTFCIPDLQNKVVWGKSPNNLLGESIEAGLPNITGYFTATGGTVSGAFSQVTGARRPGGSGASDWQAGVSFDASLANSIYGKSSTVQPPAIVTNFLIKY